MCNLEVTETKTCVVIEGSVECGDCGGTGLYVGFAEHDGAAVECSCCKGTGEKDIFKMYNKFYNKKRRDKVKRVYLSGTGYGMSAEDFVDKHGKTIQFSKYGCSYDDWLFNGINPVPVKDLLCPCQQYHLKYGDSAFYLKRCVISFKDNKDCQACPNYNSKNICWELYENENKKAV